MFKRIAFVVAVIFAALSIVAMPAKDACAKEYKIGYVDLAKVFDLYGKTKEAEKNLSEKGKVKENERRVMVDELRKLKDEQALLSDKAKAEKQTVIDDKIKKLQDYDGKAQDELLKERNDMLGGILKDIEKTVGDYAKETGYDIILNSRTLLYGGEQYDLTEEILKRLNK
jgi:Skp family chaperone for outer membrane proteins